MQETRNITQQQTSRSSAENSQMHLTSTVGLFRGIIEYCRQHNIPTAAVLAEAQLTEDCLTDIDRRISSESYHYALTKAAELSGDPDFGVHIGESIKPGHYGAVGLVAMSCEKAGELLQLHIRYQSLIGDDTRVEYEVNDSAIELKIFPKLACMQNSRLRQESAFASWITLARWITELTDHNPLRINFTTPKPDNTAELYRVFGPNIFWQQPIAGASFDKALIDARLPQSNPTLRRQLEAQAEAQLIAAGGEQLEPLLLQVQALIAKRLADGAPTVEMVAAELSLSTRVLQRKLNQLNSSFSQLFDTTRKELAMSYVDKLHISLTEIAFLLGFSEQSAFNRAFKRWTQQSPSAYRKALKADT